MSQSVTSRILFMYICAYILCTYCIYIANCIYIAHTKLSQTSLAISLFHHIEVEYASVLSVRVCTGKLCGVRFTHIWRATYKSVVLQ